MTTLVPTTPRLAASGAELTALAERFCLRAFAAGAFFCGAAAVSALVMLPLRDSADPVTWSTPTVLLTALVAIAAFAVAWLPAPVYRALCRRPDLELVPVMLAAAMLAYPLRSELWWPSCALVMLVAQVAPLRRTWSYCAVVLITNLAAHALSGDLAESPAVSILGLWIGFGFWTTLTGLVVERIARHLLRVDVGQVGPPASTAALALELATWAAPNRAAQDADPEPAGSSHGVPAEAVTVVEATPFEAVEPRVPAVVPAPAPASNALADPTLKLTRRQLEVVALLADGHRYDEIAKCLSISRRQVQRHVTSAVERLGVHNANELVAIAVASGFVPPMS